MMRERHGGTFTSGLIFAQRPKVFETRERERERERARIFVPSKTSSVWEKSLFQRAADSALFFRNISSTFAIIYWRSLRNG